MRQVFTDFVTLLVVLNPLGKLPIFLGNTAALERPVRDAVAFRAVAIAFGVLFFFLAAGQVLLDALGISLVSFRLAGSLVLLIFSFSMIFEAAQPPPPAPPDLTPSEIAVFPLAIPALAGPGSILAVVVLTDNERFAWDHQALTVIALMLALAVCFLAMRLATPLVHLLRRPGISIISRVMGLILAALAMEGMVQCAKAILRSVYPPPM